MQEQAGHPEGARLVTEQTGVEKQRQEEDRADLIGREAIVERVEKIGPGADGAVLHDAGLLVEDERGVDGRPGRQKGDHHHRDDRKPREPAHGRPHRENSPEAVMSAAQVRQQGEQE
jgi:hypothetical protein